jgi:hypothetical protein
VVGAPWTGAVPRESRHDPGGNPGRTVRRPPGGRVRLGTADDCGPAVAARRGTAAGRGSRSPACSPLASRTRQLAAVLPALAGTTAGRRRGPAPRRQAQLLPAPASCRNHPYRVSWLPAGFTGDRARPGRAGHARPALQARRYFHSVRRGVSPDLGRGSISVKRLSPAVAVCPKACCPEAFVSRYGRRPALSRCWWCAQERCDGR